MKDNHHQIRWANNIGTHLLMNTEIQIGTNISSQWDNLTFNNKIMPWTTCKPSYCQNCSTLILAGHRY